MAGILQDAAMPQEAAKTGAKEQEQEQAQSGSIDPKMAELFQLVASRVTDALAASAEGLESALKADPYHAAVEFGTEALRSVVAAAEEAGKTIPFEVIFAAGMQAIKDIAEIAVTKGFLQDEEIETFLKEVLQQSINRYTQLDRDDGKISDDDMRALQSRMGGAAQGTK